MERYNTSTGRLRVGDCRGSGNQAIRVNKVIKVKRSSRDQEGISVRVRVEGQLQRQSFQSVRYITVSSVIGGHWYTCNTKVLVLPYKYRYSVLVRYTQYSSTSNSIQLLVLVDYLYSTMY